MLYHAKSNSNYFMYFIIWLLVGFKSPINFSYLFDMFYRSPLHHQEAPLFPQFKYIPNGQQIMQKQTSNVTRHLPPTFLTSYHLTKY